MTFADGGKIEIAEIPAVSALNMKNLLYLSNLDIADLSKLTTLTVENCNTVDLIEMLESAPNINRVRLTGVDWELEDTDILERIYGMYGIDKDGYNIDKAVLTGNIHVPMVREQELYNYKTAWPDLEITYNTLIKQYVVKFLNTDGTILDTQYIIEGEKPVDPTTRETNPIEIPTMESSVSTDFTFAGWDSDFVAAFENAVITAVYTESTREYTIQYMANGNILQTTKAPYGSTVWYEGEIPTYTAEEAAYRYYLFDGWDKSGYVNGDKTVNAVYDTCKYTAGYFDDTDLSQLRPVEIYAMIKLADAGIGFDIANYVDLKDSISVTFGNDINYEDVEEKVLIEEPVVFSGSNQIDTETLLFDEDKDFVLAIDYVLASGNSNGNVLAQCYSDNGMSGFRLWYNSGVKLGHGTESTTPSEVNTREVLVIRHIKGETGLHVYTSNTSADSTSYVELDGDRSVIHNSPLVFGCSKSDDGSYEKHAKGTIYWSKIWYADLGDNVCKELVAWPHETIGFEMCGFKKYFLSDNASKRSSMSFLASTTLSKPQRLNDSNATAGGWAEASLNVFLNNRVYNAFPLKWRQLLKNVSVKSSAGNKSTAITSSGCYVFIPAVVEMDSSKDTEPYINEGAAIEFFTTNASRICYTPDGTAVGYWTRSPFVSYETYQYVISHTGSVSGYNQPDTEYYVRMMISI